jgi:hypothetical protein
MTAQGPAPLFHELLQDGVNLSRGWLHFFETIGDSISGEWSIGQRQLTQVGIDTVPDTSYISYQGREIRFLFVWDAGMSASPGNSITLAASDLTMLPGMLEIWEDSVINIGAFASEKTITIPVQTYTGRVIIQGTVLLKVQDPRGV